MLLIFCSLLKLFVGASGNETNNDEFKNGFVIKVYGNITIELSTR